MAPRVFQYLFTEIDKAQDENVSQLESASAKQQALQPWTASGYTYLLAAALSLPCKSTDPCSTSRGNPSKDVPKTSSYPAAAEVFMP
jgi:hypothetical protein